MQSYPDIERWTRRAEHWLTKSDLDDHHRKQLREAGPKERNKLYQELIVWYQIRDAKLACKDFRKCLDYKSIFVRPEIKKVFAQIDDLLFNAIISRKISVQASDHTQWFKIETVRKR